MSYEITDTQATHLAQKFLEHGHAYPLPVDCMNLAKALLKAQESRDDLLQLTGVLLSIVEHVDQGRPRDWHVYPGRLRDEAVAALAKAGVAVKPYDDCEAAVAKDGPRFTIPQDRPW